MQEVAGSPGMGRALAQAVFADSLLSDDVRRRGGAALARLLARSPPLLQRADVAAGLAAFMLTYADQASATPAACSLILPSPRANARATRMRA